MKEDERRLEKTIFSFEMLIYLEALANKVSGHTNIYGPRWVFANALHV